LFHLRGTTTTGLTELRASGVWGLGAVCGVPRAPRGR
jgi:hypothetical protein